MVAVQIAKSKTLLSMPGIIPTSEENTVALDQQNIST